MGKVRAYTYNEELANTITHALGIVLGLIAGYLLLTKAMQHSGYWAVVSVWVYLFGMMISYVSSTLYHGSHQKSRKQKLQQIDHAAIYLHIAGTYTPFTLVTLRHAGLWGWATFTIVWLTAFIGVKSSFRSHEKHSHLETISYVLMGCVVLIAFKPLVEILQQAGKMDVLYWIITGGISYIIGAVFYSLTQIKYMHTVFHVFVFLGSLCHIIAIYEAL